MENLDPKLSLNTSAGASVPADNAAPAPNRRATCT